jgi:hypothetical protein
VVRDVVNEPKIVARGGAPEKEVARARALPSDSSFTSKIVRGVGFEPTTKWRYRHLFQHNPLFLVASRILI